VFNKTKKIAIVSAIAVFMSTGLFAGANSAAQADVLTGIASWPQNVTFETADAANDFASPTSTEKSTLTVVPTAEAPTDALPDFDPFDHGDFVAKVVDNSQLSATTPVLKFNPVEDVNFDTNLVTMQVYVPVAKKTKLTMTMQGTKPGEPSFGDIGYAPHTIATSVQVTEVGWQEVYFDFSGSSSGDRTINFNGFDLAIEYTRSTYSGEPWYFDNFKSEDALKRIPRTNPSKVFGFEAADAGTVGPDAGQVVTDAPAKGDAVSNRSLKLNRPVQCGTFPTLMYIAPTGESVISSDSLVIKANIYSDHIGEQAQLAVGYSPYVWLFSSVTETTKVGWQLMSFDFSNSGFDAGGLDAERIYNRVLLDPNRIENQQNTCNQHDPYYVDDLAFNGAEPASLTGGQVVTPPVVTPPVVTPPVVTPPVVTPPVVTPPGTAAAPTGSATLPTGASLADATVDVVLTGLDPLSAVSVFAKSRPVLIATGFADATGAFRKTVSLPSTLKAGDHSVVATVKDASGATKTITVVKFAVTANKKIATFKPVAVSSASPMPGKVLVTIKKAKGKQVRISVVGRPEVRKTITSDNFAVTVPSRKGRHTVVVSVGSQKIFKKQKVK